MKDEGRGMKDEVKANCFHFIPHPSSFILPLDASHTSPYNPRSRSSERKK
jgi:hypothetical protein